MAGRYYKVSGLSPEELIASFGNSYHPRIAVTVDEIATATDIKPVEIVFFMRLVKSWVLFEQVLGRGNRVIGTTALQAVTSDVEVKDHFIIIDAVGVVEQPKIHTRSLEQKPSVSLKEAAGPGDPGRADTETLETLAGCVRPSSSGL